MNGIRKFFVELSLSRRLTGPGKKEREFMTATKPLMQKATAVWLVDNTSLTFEQIAEFCGMHYLEIKGIADGDVAHGVRGKNPITAGELTRDEIKRGENNPNYKLRLAEAKVEIPEIKVKKRPRYTPVSRRQDRPNAVLWLLRNHPELKDAQIMRLVGTTKPTIQQIRDRSHWNSANLQPQDPVTLGLCSQTDLDLEVQKGATRVAKERVAQGLPPEPVGTLLPTDETTGYVLPGSERPPERDGPRLSADQVFGKPGAHVEREEDKAKADEADEAARVFAKLQGMHSGPEQDEDDDADEDDAGDKS
jgi:uncharacterized protein